MTPLPLQDQWLVLKHDKPLTFDWREHRFSCERTGGNVYRVYTAPAKFTMTGVFEVKLCRKMHPSKNPPRWWFISFVRPGRVVSRYRHADEMPDTEFKSLRAAIAGAADHLISMMVDASLTRDPKLPMETTLSGNRP